MVGKSSRSRPSGARRGRRAALGGDRAILCAESVKWNRLLAPFSRAGSRGRSNLRCRWASGVWRFVSLLWGGMLRALSAGSGLGILSKGAGNLRERWRARDASRCGATRWCATAAVHCDHIGALQPQRCTAQI